PYLDRMRSELRDTRALFTGVLHGDELSQAFASSDLFLYPSSADSLGHEVLQAQASGLPVLVGDRGGARENLIPGETGRVLPGDDPETFAQSILELLDHPEQLMHMAMRARTSLEHRSAGSSLTQAGQMDAQQAPAPASAEAGDAGERFDRKN
ncbi:MAG: glycosyltransferase, partial [Desulfohalobiaceae bacterium]